MYTKIYKIFIKILIPFGRVHNSCAPMCGFAGYPLAQQPPMLTLANTTDNTKSQFGP